MKKQLSILVTTFTIVALVSCSKQKIETQQPDNFEEVATAKKPGGGNSFTPVSNKGLLGRFEFNYNLKDATGQLADGVPTVNRVLYTTDRKGVADKAIRFNAAYGVDIFDVPSTPDGASVSLWIKHDTIPAEFWAVVLFNFKGFGIQQLQQIFFCNYWNNLDNQQNVSAYPIDKKWHHFAITRDNTSMNLYVDGIFIGSSPTPSGVGGYSPLDIYHVGYGGSSFWKGSIDDLRFYGRVLSADEINTLANQ
jgi:hypothetical protein